MNFGGSPNPTLVCCTVGELPSQFAANPTISLKISSYCNVSKPNHVNGREDDDNVHREDDGSLVASNGQHLVV